MSRQYVPNQPQQVDAKVISGGAAAILVAMINRTEGFDVGNQGHIESVKSAIAEILPAFVLATVDAQQRANAANFAE